MREKNLFNLILGLNAALALAFVAYLFISSSSHPEVESSQFPGPEQMAANKKSMDWPEEKTESTPEPSPGGTNEQTVAEETKSDSIPGNDSKPGLDQRETGPTAKPVFTQKKFTWRDITNAQYQVYVDSLRAVGCPEDKIRYIILTDINQLMDEKRLQASIQHDQDWWMAQPPTQMVNVLQEKGRNLEEERSNLIARWLGEEAADAERNESVFWSNVQLTGPVLGKLNTQDHKVVQDICADSIDRYQTIFWSSVNAGQTMNKLDLAKLREGTRSNLVKVLGETEMEEFLLRYSHNSSNLRQELRGLNPTPEEFRKIFRATDPLDHSMQMKYGSIELLSPQQRERHHRLRDTAIKEALGENRYQAYLLTKDPLFQKAQSLARSYGAPSSAVQGIYERIQALDKSTQSRRQQIITNTKLSPLERQRALQALITEQNMAYRRIASEAASFNKKRL